MKKIFVLFILYSCFHQTAQSSEIGVGVAVDGRPYLVTIPVVTANNYKFESYLKYQRMISDNGSSHYDSLNYELGLGMYKELKNNRHTLYGGIRVGFVAKDSKRTSPFSFSVAGSPATTQTTDTYLKGYAVAPVAGFKYLATDKISVGGEISYYYSALKGVEATDDSGGAVIPDIDASNTNQRTETRILLRYFF